MKGLIKRIGKKIIPPLAIAGIVSGGCGVANGIRDYSEFKNNKEERIKLEVYKTFVIDRVDYDGDGLSFEEDYMIKQLMHIKDSSKNYVPTFEDWERAYKFITSW